MYIMEQLNPDKLLLQPGAIGGPFPIAKVATNTTVKLLSKIFCCEIQHLATHSKTTIIFLSYQPMAYSLDEEKDVGICTRPEETEGPETRP